MKGWNWIADRLPLLVSGGAAPAASALILSVFAHLVMLLLLVVFRHSLAVHLAPVKYQVSRRIQGKVYLSLNPKQTPSLAPPAHARRSSRRLPAPQPGSGQEGTASAELREQAKQATAAITMSLKFKGLYGFYPGPQYQLAVQTAGDLPPILPAELPPHFQQYVIVEVTIDTDGRVAEARIVAGIVDTTIQQTLLSAIREFKYSPAKRDGVPIPSQRDIVVHIPS